MKILSLALLLLLACCLSGCSKPDQSPPNIVFFLADDIRYDFFGYSGHPVVQTPNIDRLAENGTVFEKMYVNTSTC